MRFRITHQTEYHYRVPASESYGELRVNPSTNFHQRVIKRRLEVHPATRIQNYTDHFGNHVEFFSIPFRHNRLVVRSHAEVETSAVTPPENVLDVAVAEARQILNSRLLKIYPFLQPSTHVPLHKVLLPLKKNFICADQPLGDTLLRLNRWIYENFKYKPGTTDVSTPLDEVIRLRRGVCQDFAHLMISILRTYGIPARYVSGYIESHDPTQKDPALVGAAASHAWVEACLPGGFWWGLDPTNNQTAGERHVRVAIGRDYHDVAPLRGTYKGAQDQKLEVMVSVKRSGN
ncbi:MAG: transglutaminase family protein [Candidatus Methylacidiphilales bacterium]|nr:transglutaminase family protein [Candidatus Methylacidiphilales bacterium]